MIDSFHNSMSSLNGGFLFNHEINEKSGKTTDT